VAPADAPYSKENVKKRKIHDQKSRETRERLHARRKHVRRSPLFSHPLCGGPLSREFGDEVRDFISPAIASGLQRGTIIQQDNLVRLSAITAFDHDAQTQRLLVGK
jgi:hypothetical protein